MYAVEDSNLKVTEKLLCMPYGIPILKATERLLIFNKQWSCWYFCFDI